LITITIETPNQTERYCIFLNVNCPPLGVVKSELTPRQHTVNDYLPGQLHQVYNDTTKIKLCEHFIPSTVASLELPLADWHSSLSPIFISPLSPYLPLPLHCPTYWAYNASLRMLIMLRRN